MTNEELIKERMEKIERLKDEIKNIKKEIKELKDPVNIAEGVKCGMWKTRDIYGKVKWQFCENVGRDDPAWLNIKDLCLILYSYRYNLTPKRMKVSMLSKAEIKTAAAMAEEIVAIWNKYFEKEYIEKTKVPTFETGEELENALAEFREKNK